MSLLLSLLLGSNLVLATPGVVRLPIHRQQSPSPLSKRNNPQPVDLENYGSLYRINVTIGAPPQVLEVQLDTGSSDLWVFGPNAMPGCTNCGGSFDISESTSAVDGPNTFYITYGTPGSFVKGSYFQDTLTIGSLTVKQQTMAVATSAAAENLGIFGIGLDATESIVNQQGGKSYPSVLDNMQSQGLIQRRIFSMYLDDKDAASGSILFGGYDRAKYTGSLTALNMMPDASTGTVSRYYIAWSAMAITTSTGATYQQSYRGFPIPALLDSGTTLSQIPRALFNQVASAAGMINSTAYGLLVSCEIEGFWDLQFGGSGGPVISVPFTELARPLPGPALTLADGSRACGFGVAPTDGIVILGDTFLRSAYVVYDVDNLEIWIANSVYNSTQSDIVAVGGGSQNAPASSAVGVTVTASGTRMVLPTQVMSVTQATTLSQGAAQVTGPVSGATTQLGATGAHGAAATTGSASGTPSPSHGAASVLVPASSDYRGMGVWLGVFTVAAGVGAFGFAWQ